MKQKSTNRGQIAIGLALGLTIVASLAFIKPFFPVDESKGNANGYATGKAHSSKVPAADLTDEAVLVSALEADGLISSKDGFQVVASNQKLFVNGKQMAENVAEKYLKKITSNNLKIDVHPFSQRLQQHPDADFMQMALPVLMSSPCVEMPTAKKPGC